MPFLPEWKIHIVLFIDAPANDLCSRNASARALIFNCTSGRSGLSLLRALTSALAAGDESRSIKQPFQHVVFCTNTTYASGSSKGGELASSILFSRQPPGTDRAFRFIGQSPLHSIPAPIAITFSRQTSLPTQSTPRTSRPSRRSGNWPPRGTSSPLRSPPLPIRRPRRYTSSGRSRRRSGSSGRQQQIMTGMCRLWSRGVCTSSAASWPWQIFRSDS